eukprot:scaffold14071_cov105-Isochrysis_galbana.AAC.3
MAKRLRASNLAGAPPLRPPRYSRPGSAGCPPTVLPVAPLAVGRGSSSAPTAKPHQPGRADNGAGIPPSGTLPGCIPPNGTHPDGMPPSGIAPSGMPPDGTHGGGMPPSCIPPGGMPPIGILPAHCDADRATPSPPAPLNIACMAGPPMCPCPPPTVCTATACIGAPCIADPVAPRPPSRIHTAPAFPLPAPG